MSSAVALHLEDVIQDIGGCGRFQIILSVIIHSMKCIVCFTMVFMAFGAAVPDWWCMDEFFEQNSTTVPTTTNITQYKSCTAFNGTKQCSSFFYADTMKTVVTEWDLVCSQAWATQTITSIQMAGVLLGNLFCGQLADLIGRKPPLFIAVASMVVLNLIAAFSTSWLMFAVIRFFLGLAMGLELTVHYNLMSEFTPARWRAWVVAVPSWALELCLFALGAWLLKNWQYMHVLTTCIGVPLLVTWWFVPESFRWYVSHDKVRDAEKIIKFIAQINGQKLVDTSSLKKLTENEKEAAKDKQVDKKYTLLDVIKDSSLLKLALFLSWIWFSVGVSGYGIQFGVQKLSGSVYLNIFLIGLLGSPMSFITIYLCNRFGRKKTAWLLLFGSSVTAVLVGIAQYISVAYQFPSDVNYRDKATGNLMANICALTSLVLMNAGWSPIQILTIEVFPTVVRNIGYGSLNTMARVGAIVGPQLVFLGTMVPGLLYFVCAIAGFLSMAFLIPVPETNKADLKDLIIDIQVKQPEEDSKDSSSLCSSQDKTFQR